MTLATDLKTVRCPYCGKIAARLGLSLPAAAVTLECGRCKASFTRELTFG